MIANIKQIYIKIIYPSPVKKNMLLSTLAYLLSFDFVGHRTVVKRYFITVSDNITAFKHYTEADYTPSFSNVLQCVVLVHGQTPQAKYRRDRTGPKWRRLIIS